MFCMKSFFWVLYRLFLFGSMWTYSFGFYIWSLVNYMLFLWFQFFASWVFVLSTSLILFFIWSICFASIFVMCSVAFFRWCWSMYFASAGVVLPGGPRPAKAIFWLALLASHNFV